MPLAGGLLEATFDLAALSELLEPVLEGVPAANQGFVGDFVGEGFTGVAGDDKAAFDQRLGGGLATWVYTGGLEAAAEAAGVRLDLGGYTLAQIARFGGLLVASWALIALGAGQRTRWFRAR